MVPSVTVFTSDKVPLGKRFWLAEGEIRKESNATLYAGTAETRRAASASELATLLEQLGTRQALASGLLIEGDRARIGTRAKAGAGDRLRSLADFAFPRAPGWLLWDFDAKSMPPEVAARVEALGGPLRALFRIWPEAEAGPYVIRPSSSDGVTAPGCDAIRSAGLHGFFLIEDVAQSRAALETLQTRAWAEGLAWCTLSKSGAVLVRSIVDVAVGSPERLIFEAPPILEAPVTREPRPTLIRDASTPLAVPETPLEVAARAVREETSARVAIKPEARKAEEAFVEERAQAEAERTGKPLPEARASIRQMMRGAVLEDDHLLQLSDGTWKRVGEILDNADRWDRRSLPDPIEGLAYGRDKATLLLRPRPGHPTDKPALVSHAHGQRTVYRFARFDENPGPEPYHPAPTGDRKAQLAKHPEAIRGFFGEASRMVRAAKRVARAYAELADDLEPRERARRQLAIRREAQARYGLPYLPTPRLREGQNAPRVMVGGAQGVGKTRATAEALAQAGGMVVLVLTTGHAKCAELVEEIHARSDERSPTVLQLKGRGASEGPEGMTMCLVPKPAAALGKLGLSVPKTLCVRCPFKDSCGYLAQEARLRRLASEPQGVVIVAPLDYAFIPLPGDVKPDLVVFDEAARNLGHITAALTFDALGAPLTYDGPARRKGAEAEAQEAADAYAAMLADVRPLRVMMRDAWQETPEAPLRTLRARGLTAEWVERALAALHDFEDRTIGERLGRELDAYNFAALNGRGLNLEKRLLGAIESHHDKGLRAFRRICEALLLELAHGRDEAVAILRADNVDPPSPDSPPRQGIVAHLLQAPYFGAELPFLHLDGTGDHRMAEQLFGPLRLEWHPVERPAHVVQVTGRSFSRQSITGLDSRGEALPWQQKEDAQLRADLVAYCHGQPDALVVANKGVIEVLKSAGLRNKAAHFNDLRGRNAWEDLPAVIVIGREQPSPAAVEAIARAYAARAGDVFRGLDKGERWLSETRGLRMRDGTARALEVETHPDPWAARVLAQIREGEALQALDRVRPHFKPEPVRVHLLSPIVLDVTVDRVEAWTSAKQGGSKVERALARGVLPLSEREASRVHPDIWPNRKAVQRDREFQDLRAQIEAGSCWGHSPKRDSSLASVPSKSPQLVASYLRPSEGHGGSRTVFRALILATTREAEDRLEALAGRVEDFRVETFNEAAEPRARPEFLDTEKRPQAPTQAPPAAIIVRLPQAPPASPAPVPEPVPLRPAVGRGPP